MKNDNSQMDFGKWFAGYDIRTVQELPGHTDVKRCENDDDLRAVLNCVALAVRSPLD